ncbi:MAG: endosialidase [Anaerostipes sp.]|uniref:endosialidase n=1 Tax=Anaerostipes sp. 992a TaxID=1261637 RepID=UPI000951A6A5|nr:endosialidase [Anaerostipes sp. 992a]MCI5950852.1 endosialidase [Anaerostipes sp.]MDD5968654.1 endosialidase [Anaerostipes sp.]OLR63646.1 endosialidase [Anaerostipes sp. 992a]
MAVVKDLITVENDSTLSFGDYSLTAKTKKDNFQFEGDLYKIKTYKTITKLEKNGMMIYESVPGTTVHNFSVTDAVMSFSVEGPEDAQITLELEPEMEYKVFVDDTNVGRMKTNLGGKLNISIEMNLNQVVNVKVVKL